MGGGDGRTGRLRYGYLGLAGVDEMMAFVCGD